MIRTIGYGGKKPTEFFNELRERWLNFNHRGGK
jgi:hypothetical protein